MVAVATIFDLKVSMINDAVTIFSVWDEVKGKDCSTLYNIQWIFYIENLRDTHTIGKN